MCTRHTVAKLGFALALLTHSGSVLAQGGTGQNLLRPRPGFERLSVFEGTWRNPAEARGEESCGWQAGARRHMICRARIETASGVREQTSIFSYRNRDSTYVVNVLIASGQLFTYMGRVDGDRWVLDLQGSPGSTQRLRMVVTPEPESIRFVEESSENGGPWQVTEDFTHVRVVRP